MENKVKYPVKYAVLELKVNGDWKIDYKDKTIGFIVSKCRVVSQTIRYLEDGTSVSSYQVVFPYKNVEEYKNRISGNLSLDENERIPNFGSYGNCLNATVVSEIYDTYDEAAEAAEYENSSIESCVYVLCNQPSCYNCEEKLREYETNMELCKSFERDILEATKELPITSESISVKQFIKKKSE